MRDVVSVGSKLIDISSVQELPLPRQEVKSQAESVKDHPNKPVVETFNKPGKFMASPAVRKILSENQITLEKVGEWCKKSLITKQDVNEYLQQMKAGKEKPPTTMPTDSADEEIELMGYNRVMFMKMTEALSIPHTVYSDAADVTEMFKSVADLNKERKEMGLSKISFLSFVIKAASLSLEKYPKLNSSIKFDQQKPKLVLKKKHNIGVAVDTSYGLVVPVIKDVQNKNISEIASDLSRLIELAEKDSLSFSDIENPTFTISNVGSIGGSSFSPIIVPPQVGILATGRIKTVVNGSEVAHLFPVSLAADHRVIDGATGSRFTIQLFSYLKNPCKLLTKLR